jgi:hypothetical protein
MVGYQTRSWYQKKMAACGESRELLEKFHIVEY